MTGTGEKLEMTLLTASEVGNAMPVEGWWLVVSF